MKALITGVSGFVGTHLSELLLQNNYEVFGLSRSQPQNKDIIFTSCDINNADLVKATLERIKPDEIYHLSGAAFIPHSYEKPLEAYHTIVNGTLSLYEGIRKLGLDSKILYVGSAEVYGEGLKRPFIETDLLHPSNPYAGAKTCADMISEQYFRTYEMNIIRTRPFNHTGPGQSSDFVCSSFAMQIAQLEKQGEQAIGVGNIEVKRDFLDVRDVVKAYHALMKKGTIGEAYNICSNNAIPISEILEYLFFASDLEEWNVQVDLLKVRENDASIRVGNNSKLIYDTNWTPQFNLKDTMKDLLEYWRERIRS